MLSPAFRGGQAVKSNPTICIRLLAPPKQTEDDCASPGLAGQMLSAFALSLQSDCCPQVLALQRVWGPYLCLLGPQKAEVLSWSPKSVSFRSYTSLCIRALLNQQNPFL